MDSTKPSPTRVTMPFDQAKIDSQMAQLTLAEKVSLLGGSGFATTTGVPRLGIESMKACIALSLSITEGVNGVKNAMMIDSGDSVGDVLAGKGPKTVCFPSTSCFAATWDMELIRQLGEALAQQARQKGISTIMGPGVNLHRDPRGGRNFEYFSEDPLLTGQLAAAMINGIQANGVGACLKHFVGNEAEDYRRSYDVVDPTGGRALRELYLAAFQEALRHSDPVAVMTSYNKVDGVHTSETPLITKVLRNEWNYTGAVQSDWFGTASTVESVLAGQDLEMPGPPIWRGQRLVDAVNQGKVTEAQIDERARKMLEWIDRTSSTNSHSQSDSEDSAKAIATSHKVAAEGLVLLKNDARALPLDLTKALKVTVCGLPAVDLPVGGGGSSLAPPLSVKRPLDCIRDLHSQPDLVDYAGGVSVNKTVPLVPARIMRNPEDGSQTIKVSYFNDTSPTVVHEESLGTAQVMMLGHVKPGLNEAGFNYVMSTSLLPAVGGAHTIAVRSTGSHRLLIDGAEVLSAPAIVSNAEDLLFTPHKLEKSIAYPMEAGRSYAVELHVHDQKSPKQKPNEPGAYAAALCFQEEHSSEKAIAAAAEAAARSDVAVVFAGRNAEHECEGCDLPDIQIPRDQVQLIQAVADKSKKTVVVLFGGGALDVSAFVDSVDAILFAHYPGQEGGAAIADVLAGKINPSGKLATTWPRHLEDAATWKHFPARRGSDGAATLSLVEGLEVGYRRDWAQVADGPQYLFGFGLSYTSFSCENLALHPSTLCFTESENVAEISVRLTLANTGPVAGSEVVQVYVAPSSKNGSLAMHPMRALKGFKKVALEAGESKDVEIVLDAKSALSYWDTAISKWRIERGQYTFSIGTGIDGLSQDLTVAEDQEWLHL